MKTATLFRLLVVVPASLLAASVCLGQPGQQPPRLVSPEIADDGDVTFRLRAPSAEAVTLNAGDIPGADFGAGSALAKGDDGVFTLTLETVPLGAYRYTFNVDGVSTLDPSNRHTSESNAAPWSLFYVPGAELMDTRDVAHGAVAEVTYRSTVLDRPRRMHVYTPPGYARSAGDYPVFYLLHGAMDSDDSWSTVGRAGFILDNLIADGRAEPMIVVMPDGHTGPFAMGAGGLPLEEFANEFATDIKPYVEANYRARTAREDTAIAGLSMGGAQTLEIAMRDLADYGYIGVFSAGVFGVTESSFFEDQHAATLSDETLRDGLELLWFATGSEDFLLGTTESTVELFGEHGFDVEYQETAGGHTWVNWREYLRDFAPRLFK